MQAFSFMNNLKIIRTMPNTPMQVGEGCTVYTPGRYVTNQDLEKTHLILNSLGIAQQVPEKMINSIAGLSGCGPAYVCFLLHFFALSAVTKYSFYIEKEKIKWCSNGISIYSQVFTVIEAMADGAVKQGVPRQMALQFAAQTVLGAAKTVLQTEKHPAVLRDEVSFRY